MKGQFTEHFVESGQANLQRISLALSQGAIARARQLINEDFTAPDIAHVLSSVPQNKGIFSGILLRLRSWLLMFWLTLAKKNDLRS